MMRVSVAICKIIEKVILSTQLDVQKELKGCAKHIERADLAKTLKKVTSSVKYEYIEQLFAHINSRMDRIPQHELMDLPEHEWIK
jgi:hypothetical protein